MIPSCMVCISIPFPCFSPFLILLDFHIEAFIGLRTLILNGCPPSTVKDIYSLRPQLQALEIFNSGISDLSSLLAPIKQKHLQGFKPMLMPLGNCRKPKSEFIWHSLKTLRLCNCGLTRLKSCLHMTPYLEHLDIAENDISHIFHLQDCPRLTVLNASSNRIRVLSNIALVITHIQRLNLSNNFIESLDGLDQLRQLQRLDLSRNKLISYNEVNTLATLPKLSHLYLLLNPFSINENYRLHIFAQFLDHCIGANLPPPILDDVAISPEEDRLIKFVLPFVP
jgi:hypothetical protein